MPRSGRAGWLRQVPEPVVAPGHQDGLGGDTGAGAVAGQQVGPIAQTEGAQQGEAVQDVADVIGVDGLAGRVRVVRGGGVGKRGAGGHLREGIVDRGDGQQGAAGSTAEKAWATAGSIEAVVNPGSRQAPPWTWTW